MAITKDANGMVQLDADQVIRTTADVTDDGQLVQRVVNVGNTLVPKVYDEYSITYITSGNGTGEVGTIVYKLNSVTVCTLNITYDVSNRVINVARV